MTIKNATFGHLQVHRFPIALMSELKIHCIKKGLNKTDFVIDVLAKAVGVKLDTLPKPNLPRNNAKARRERAAAAAIKVAEDAHK